MFIGKTELNKDALIQLGKQLFNTKRTHVNDLVALQYMMNDRINEYDSIRMSINFAPLINYTFCWVMSPGMYHRYATNELNIQIKEIVNEDHQTAYVCFFTGNVQQWVIYCMDTTHPPDLRDEVKACLSKDGYSLLFKEVKRLE